MYERLRSDKRELHKRGMTDIMQKERRLAELDKIPKYESCRKTVSYGWQKRKRILKKCVLCKL